MTIKNQWQIGASPELLQIRSRYHALIRAFFLNKQVLEVETPILGYYTATDAFTTSINYQAKTHQGYLQTSPESYLKQYIARYPRCDVYSLSKAFRDDASALWHQPEFTLLEWYRHGFTWQQLSDEVIELIKTLAPKQAFKVTKIAYAECFERYVGVSLYDEAINWQEIYDGDNHHQSSEVVGVEYQDDRLWQQLIWSDHIEPYFMQSPQQQEQKINKIIVVYDYPQELALMAKVMPSDEVGSVLQAKRFEIYYNGIELANGWEEETEGQKIQNTMQQDIMERKNRALPIIPMDRPLLQAINTIGEMSGVAVGIDRLYSQLQELDSINQMMAFYQDNDKLRPLH